MMPFEALRMRKAAPAAVVPLSSPLDLSGCSFWYDFQDASTLFTDQAGTTPVATPNTDRIGRVNDKSGNSRVVSQGTSAARPIWEESGGLRWARFNGANYNLLHALTNTPVSTVFAVALIRSAGSANFGGMLTNLNSQVTGVGFVWVRDNSTSQWFVSQSAGNGLADSSHQWVNRVNTASWSVLNKAVYSIDGTGHSNRVLPTGAAIGIDRIISGRYLNFDLYEMFAYDTILSAGDRARAEQYLGDRYGITLP